MVSAEVLRAENRNLRHQLRSAKAESTRLEGIITRKDEQIAMLIATHHREKMALINSLEQHMDEILRLHQQLVGQVHTNENRVTTSPEGGKVHGFAMTIRPLRQP
ncbi:hypothetical protein ON010_g11766 [Phytophthora cinnamomi]|nr:hypothetical protein ON010_g11766 [Phytophthora cinnamomi]